MKMFKKVLSAVTASALTLSMAAGSAAMFSSVSAADLDSMTAVELVEDMGTGWNLGNSFDCTNTWTTPLTPTAIETAWQNPVTTQSMIDAITFYGFNTVRIPVTWYQMTDSSGNIDTTYLARIKEVVDYCYANDVYVIINMHHDGLTSAEGGWLADAGVNGKDRFTTMWTQIATYFKDYDRHLAFEGWNEIDWDYSTIQTMGQAFVDAVRGAGGEYNDDRLLIIPGKATNIEATVNSSFTMPTDPANMLAVDVHFYDPTEFTVCTAGEGWGTPRSTWGTDTEIAEAKNLINQLSDRFVANGVGVILGEYGVENQDKEEESRMLYTKTVASNAMDATGMCAILWDSSNGGDMKYFDRINQTWLNAELGEFYKELSGGTYVNEDGLILTDRVTVTGTFTDAEDPNALIVDLTQFKDTTAVLKDVIWSVSVDGLTEAGYYGQVAVQSNVTDAPGTGNDSWAYIPVSIANESDVYTTSLAEWNYNGDNGTTPYDMEVYSLVYDYLKFATWYVGSDGTAPTVAFNTDVTIVFESPIWVTSDYQIPTETTEPTTDEPTTEPTTTEPTTIGGTIVYGDANEDGTTSIVDVIMVNKYVMGAETLGDSAKTNADVNLDTKVDAGDSLNILKSLVDLVTLPIGG